MTIYRLLPSPTFGYGEHSFTSWEDVFTNEEIAKIEAIGESLIPTDARVGSGLNKEYRRSKTSWIHLNDETEWIFSKLGGVVSSINGKFYGFDIFGFAEAIQYTVYSEDEQGCYDWHLDWGSNTSQRKLSIVVQLTDPAEYEGGNLEIMTSNDPNIVDKAIGRAVVFPSFTLHRVTPVTKGTRRTLVAWICGNAFK